MPHAAPAVWERGGWGVGGVGGARGGGSAWPGPGPGRRRGPRRRPLWSPDPVLARLRGAPLGAGSLAGQRVGVYVGHARGSTLVSDIGSAASVESMTAAIRQDPAYRSLPDPLQRELAEALVEGVRGRYPRIRPDGGPFTQPNAAAGWIARHLRTDGPYMAVDAPCASSFAARDPPAPAHPRGEIAPALVGGRS